MSTVALAKQQFEQEPSVKMFVYTAGALSAIPVGIFTLYAAVTLFVSLMTAGELNWQCSCLLSPRVEVDL